MGVDKLCAMSNQQPDEDEARREQVRSALTKAALALGGLVAFIAIATYLVVNVLGLNDDSGSLTRAPVDIPTPLPTTALADPTPSSTPTDEGDPTESLYPSPSISDGKLTLSASPVMVAPMERINLSGSYPGKDGITLQIQRLENGGTWSQFPASITVKDGAFATYILTGRQGDNQFRVFDPIAQTSSAPVTITIQ
jgi:hypothetical protein